MDDTRPIQVRLFPLYMHAPPPCLNQGCIEAGVVTTSLSMLSALEIRACYPLDGVMLILLDI